MTKNEDPLRPRLFLQQLFYLSIVTRLDHLLVQKVLLLADMAYKLKTSFFQSYCVFPPADVMDSGRLDI
jgi:hypothetical protein